MVTYIKYKNKNVPCVVDYGTLKNFQRETGTKLSDLENTLQDLAQTEVLFKIAVHRGFDLQKKECDYSDEELEIIIGDVYTQFLEIFTNGLFKIFSPDQKPPKQNTSKKK